MDEPAPPQPQPEVQQAAGPGGPREGDASAPAAPTLNDSTSLDEAVRPLLDQFEQSFISRLEDSRNHFVATAKEFRTGLPALNGAGLLAIGSLVQKPSHNSDLPFVAWIFFVGMWAGLLSWRGISRSYQIDVMTSQLFGSIRLQLLNSRFITTADQLTETVKNLHNSLDKSALSLKNSGKLDRMTMISILVSMVCFLVGSVCLMFLAF